MDPWFSLVLLTCSQITLSWYSAQLAEEKGYPVVLFAVSGIIPLVSLISLMLLLLLPDKRLEEHKVWFSKYRQRP